MNNTGSSVPSEQQQVAQQAVHQAISNLLLLIARGVTLRHPADIKAFGHADKLFLKVLLPVAPEEQLGIQAEPQFEALDLMLHPCVNFMVTPMTSISQVDFKDEWPPRALIYEQEKRIVVPNAGEAVKALRGKHNGQ